MFTVATKDGAELSAHGHMKFARISAVTRAAELQEPLVIHAAGKPRLVVHPDGRCEAPAGTKVPPRMACVRHEGRTCFCPPCRIERKSK